MKFIYFILLATVNLSYIDSSTESSISIDAAHLVSSEMTEEISQGNNLLVGTWYAKKILINGKPDPEKFPVNNDELTLNADMTVISIDRTHETVERGTWEMISEDQFVMITDVDRIKFRILKLTATDLEIQMLMDEVDLVIQMQKSK